jgi:hypothetical protein
VIISGEFPVISDIVVTHLRMDELLGSGDSLFSGRPQRIQLENVPEGTLTDVTIETNNQGRLSLIGLTVQASSFQDATEIGHDLVQPLLSRLAFEVDAPVQVSATFISEVATGSTQIGATVVGGVRPIREVMGPSNPELRELYATYREGLNLTSPIYQALSFWRAIEAAEIHIKRRLRKSNGNDLPDPMEETITIDLEVLKGAREWTSGNFTPYLGKSFREIKDSTRDDVRTAAAHLIPGTGSFVADRLSDIEKCVTVVPVLRHVAHRLIEEEAKNYQTN